LKEQKEIEMALVVNGTSWVGFGWRPRSLTASCRKFPVIADEGFAPSSIAEPASEPEPKSEPETSAEPKSEPEPETSSEPKSEPKSEPEPETSSKPKSEPEPETSSEPASEVAAEPAKKSQKQPLEPLALGSYKSSRISSARALPRSKQSDEYTVSTSVSYRVSSVAGRRKRAAQKGNFSSLS
jgi:outer membrane biosynthesis protein TonB